MPSVRPHARSSARLPAVAFALVSAFAAALVCVELPASSACPVSMPSPLRVRYADSVIVAVARVGDTVPVERQGVTTTMNTAFHITSLLKGESEEKVVNFQYPVLSLAGMNAAPEYEKGDVILVFLRRGEKGGYVPVDDERGIQKLAADDLKVYVRRIEELAAIMRSEKPDEAALTEWLVRCAEETATRWEGAYELAFNVSLPQDPPDEEEEEEADAAETDAETVNEEETASEDDSDAAEPATGAAESVNAESDGEEIVLTGSLRFGRSIDFAALITPAQKERLTTTLLNAEELNEGEQLLIHLVGSWKDERLVPFMLKHLARMADKPPYHAADMMRLVAHMLGDQTLIKFVANYNKTAAYEDLYDSNSAAAATYEEKPDATAEERAEQKKKFEEMKAAAAEALFLRSGKLRHFLALADQPQKP
ncbi:MAG TPA: hypothetical protein VEX70_08835 [Pyrinomonadaceae bacterium]|nr:hypothetical protein [Pyrinomonadaceae bacterium]